MSVAMSETVVKEIEQRFVVSTTCWQQYEAILQAFPDQAGVRITYLDGRLTLVSHTRRHDWFEKVLGRFVEAIAEGLGIECEVAGHATYRREDVDAGVEGDQVYYFGADAEIMRGPIPVDLKTQPPPDLAIEIEATHPADDSIAVRERLGVREVWRVNVIKETVEFAQIGTAGTYEKTSRSRAFPTLESVDLSQQLTLAEKLGWSAWVRQLNEWVRTVLLPRGGV